MNELFTQFDSTFFEKNRMSILMVLHRQGSASYNQFKALLGLPDGSLYNHMEKLSLNGYIEKRKEIAGATVQTVYSLAEKGRNQVIEYLQFMEALLKSHQEEKL